MPVSNYYGTKFGTTFLEIFTQPDDGAQRILHRQLQGQDAYDTWHLAFYFKEILAYRQMLCQDAISFEQLPRKEKNLLLYLILACYHQAESVLELGSSLLEMIDGLELVKKHMAGYNGTLPKIEPRRLSFIGVELSQLLSSASQILHPEYQITMRSSVTEVTERFDVLYDRSVSNYAFESAGEVADFVNRSQVALLNIYLSKGETFSSSRLGKSLTYFSLEEVVEGLDKPLYHLFGEKAPGPFSGPELSKGMPVVEGFFLCCQPKFATEFMAMAQRNPEINGYFQEKQVRLTNALALLGDSG